MGHYTLYFAQAYGSGNYSSCAYSEGQTDAGVCATAGTGTGTGTGSNPGGLADTGIAIASIVTLACLLIFAALVVRIWRRKPAVQNVTVSQNDQNLSPRNRS